MNQNKITQLTIIHFALLVGMISITAIFTFLSYSNPISENEGDDLLIIFLIVAVVFTISSLIGSKLIFSKLVESARKKEDFEKKISAYVTAVVIKFALIEPAAIFSALSILLTGSYYFLILIAISLFFFLVEKPSKEKLIMDLTLSQDERLNI